MAISIAKIPDSIFREYSNKNVEMLEETILNGILLPDDATNGDVIKALFPNGSYGTNGDYIHVFGVGGNGVWTFTLKWWNAPYKAGDTDGNS